MSMQRWTTSSIAISQPTRTRSQSKERGLGNNPYKSSMNTSYHAGLTQCTCVTPSPPGALHVALCHWIPTLPWQSCLRGMAHSAPQMVLCKVIPIQSPSVLAGDPPCVAARGRRLLSNSTLCDSMCLLPPTQGSTKLTESIRSSCT